MPTADDVTVEFEAKVGRYISDLNRARTTFESATGQQEAAARRMSQSVSRSFGVIGRAALGYLGAVSAIGAAQEFLRIADSAKQIEAQLRLATRESGKFAQAQADVRRIAIETRTSLEAASQLYATFQRNAAELGITQEQSARATETITKAFQISGATAAEAAGGLRQFLQGIQSGTLRGEELNSVLENAPRLARALADGLGVTIGQLRELGQAGQLTGREVLNALEGASEQINAEFAELPVTFDQAMTQVRTAATITFGAFDRGGQFSAALANFISDGTKGFADLERSAEEAGINMRASFEGLGSVFEPMVEDAIWAFNRIESEGADLASRLESLLGGRSLTSLLPTLPRVVADVYLAGRSRSEQRLRDDLTQQTIRDMFQGVDALGNPVVPGRSPASEGSSQTDAQRRAAEKKAEAERRRAIQDDAAKQAEIAQLDADILAARAAFARAAEDVLAFEIQQVDAEKAQRLARYQTEVRLGDLTQQQYEDRARRVEEAADLQKQHLRNEKARADAENHRQLERDFLRQRVEELALQSDALRAHADIAETLEQRRQLESEALAIQHEIERAMLNQAIAEGRIADAAEARRLLAERQQAEGRGLDLDNMGAMGRYAYSMRDPTQDAEAAVVRQLEAVNQGITDALAESLGTDNQFVKDMFSIFLDQVIFRPLAESLRDAGGVGGGGLLGGLLGGIGSIFGRDIGGPARAGQPYLIGKGQYQEVFVPQQNGVVVPNHRLTAQSAPTVISSPQFDLRGAVVTEQLYADMERISRANAAKAGARAYQQSMRDAPSAMEAAQRYGR